MGVSGMQIAVPKESYPGERRVALVPSAVAPLLKLGLEVSIQAGAGDEAGYPDSAYTGQGAQHSGKSQTIFFPPTSLCRSAVSGQTETAGAGRPGTAV